MARAGGPRAVHGVRCGQTRRMQPQTPAEVVAALVDRTKVPAAGVATVGAGGPAHVEVAGVTRRGGTEPVTVDDPWHIGSCTKALTAALVGRLVDRGALSWDATVGDLLDDVGGDGRDAWVGVTLDELLLCRAGLPTNLPRKAMEASWRDERALVDQRTDAVATALKGEPDGRGTFRYSNLSYVVVGAIVDRVAGVPYEHALRDELLEPLGVTSAGFGAPERVWGHRTRGGLAAVLAGRGAPADPADVRSDNPPVLNSAGRLHLSLGDWARLIPLFLDGAGDALLSPPSLDHLLATPPDGKGMAMGWMSAALPGVSLGAQGSNTAWVATAMLSTDRRRGSMVVCNDGRSRLFAASAVAAAGLLAEG